MEGEGCLRTFFGPRGDFEEGEPVQRKFPDVLRSDIYSGSEAPCSRTVSIRRTFCGARLGGAELYPCVVL